MLERPDRTCSTCISNDVLDQSSVHLRLTLCTLLPFAAIVEAIPRDRSTEQRYSDYVLERVRDEEVFAGG